MIEEFPTVRIHGGGRGKTRFLFIMEAGRSPTFLSPYLPCPGWVKVEPKVANQMRLSESSGGTA